jgi:hypothetical protein
MPSPYELRTRWLEWHNLPELEALKRQIDTIKREIANRESVIASIDRFAPEDMKGNLMALMNRNPSIAELNEVLETLLRLMPPF